MTGLEVWGDKKVLTQLGDKPLLILVLHGGMAGVLSGVALQRLQEIGVVPDAHNVRAIGGVSAGSGNALGWCHGRADTILDVYAHLADRSLQPHTQSIFDPAQVGYLVRYLEDRLGRALPMSTHLYFAVTNWKGRGVWVRAKDKPSRLFNACKASAWIPLPFSRSGVQVLKGKHGKCVDGACGFNPTDVIKRVKPGHILILGNRPLDGAPIPDERSYGPITLRLGLGFYPKAIVEGVLDIDNKVQRVLRRLSRLERIRVAGLFPTSHTALRWDEFDAGTIRERASAYYEQVARVLA